ncbi:MAG: helix-turn-helix domain-containing protein [Lachnospiraceae bacterium]|nr:helix-turn-helix domain-containing protein [Lachnospiraceae bacterium]
MKTELKYKERKDLLPFSTIKAATSGDITALGEVLEHYEGYIIKLSTTKTYDQYGRIHYCVDETLRRRLEAKLITKTLKFKIS